MSEEEGEPTEGYEEQSGQANGGPCQLCNRPRSCLRRRVNQIRGHEEQSGQANGGPCQLCDVPSTCLRRRVNQLRAMRNSQGRQVVDHASFVTVREHV